MKLSQSTHSMCREQKEETPRMQAETSIDVKNLSDRRLWEILRLAGIFTALLLGLPLTFLYLMDRFVWRKRHG